MEVNPQLWEQVKTKMKHKMEPKVMLNNSVGFQLHKLLHRSIFQETFQQKKIKF